MRQEPETAPRGPAHNPKPDIVKANPEAARLLTSFLPNILSRKEIKPENGASTLLTVTNSQV